MLRRALLLSLLLCGCAEAAPPLGDEAELRLVRLGGGRFGLELRGASGSPRALQVELGLTGGPSLVVEDVQSAPGLGLDLSRAEGRGTDRALLFAGARRAVLLPTNGLVVSFAVRTTGAGEGRLEVQSAKLASKDGTSIALWLGPALSVR